MREAVELYIQYIALTEPTPHGQIEQYKQLIRGMASGTWQFPNKFDEWRDAHWSPRVDMHSIDSPGDNELSSPTQPSSSSVVLDQLLSSLAPSHASP